MSRRVIRHNTSGGHYQQPELQTDVLRMRPAYHRRQVGCDSGLGPVGPTFATPKQQVDRQVLRGSGGLGSRPGHQQRIVPLDLYGGRAVEGPGITGSRET